MKILKWLLLIVPVLLFADGWTADVTITFKDSTNIEDTYIYSLGASAQLNYGRDAAGEANRVILKIADVNGNPQYILIRVPTFYDSCANHPEMIIDSGVLVMRVFSTSYDADDQSYVACIGIDTNMNWVEGNSDGAAGQLCEVTYDSAQMAGVGGCATAQDWQTDGASGATDTMGLFTGEAEDSTVNGGQQLFDFESAGDWITFYLDTAMMNVWKDYSYGNEGFVIKHWGGPADIYSTTFYASECNGDFADSTLYVKLYGHTAGEPTPTKGERRRRIIIGQ